LAIWACLFPQTKYTISEAEMAWFRFDGLGAKLRDRPPQSGKNCPAFPPPPPPLPGQQRTPEETSAAAVDPEARVVWLVCGSRGGGWGLKRSENDERRKKKKRKGDSRGRFARFVFNG
jgi:hypothetical protein